MRQKLYHWAITPVNVERINKYCMDSAKGINNNQFPFLYHLSVFSHYHVWPNALDNAQQRSTILRLTKLHSTKNRTLDFTQQGGQTLSTFHSTCMSSVVQYSEMSRAFGQGFTPFLFDLLYDNARHQQGLD